MEDNVTIRKNKILTNKSLDDLSFLSSDSNTLRKSLPDLSTVVCQETLDLHATIQDLREKLESAHKEIENLLQEKSCLQARVEEQESKISQLTKICSTTSTPIQTPLRQKKKRKTINVDHEYEISAIACNSTQDECNQNHLLQKTTIDGDTTAVYKDSEKEVDNGNTLSPKTSRDGASSTDKNENVRKIYVFGGKQCTGLGEKLARTRINTKYEEYKVSSIVKPWAQSSEILKGYQNVEDSAENYLILSIGESDSNPTKITLDIAALLSKFKHINIIILQIIYNPFLNEWKLNNLLKNICNNDSKCSFLSLSNLTRNKNKFLYDTCKKINYLIDSKDYENKFLLKTCSRQQANYVIEAGPKKGTIPFYFQTISKPKNISVDHFPKNCIESTQTYNVEHGNYNNLFR